MTSVKTPDAVNNLLEETEERRLDLLRTHLDRCHDLARVAETKVGNGNHEHAAPTLDRAVRGYAEIERILGQHDWDKADTHEITEKLAVLRHDLESVCNTSFQAAGR